MFRNVYILQDAEATHRVSLGKMASTNTDCFKYMMSLHGLLFMLLVLDEHHDHLVNVYVSY